MNQKAVKDQADINEALKHVETFECSVCGLHHSLSHLQQDHILHLELDGQLVDYPVCNECWVLAWCEKYEWVEKLNRLGYHAPKRICEVAPLGGRVIGTFTDCKKWEII